MSTKFRGNYLQVVPNGSYAALVVPAVCRRRLLYVTCVDSSSVNRDARVDHTVDHPFPLAAAFRCSQCCPQSHFYPLQCLTMLFLAFLSSCFLVDFLE